MSAVTNSERKPNERSFRWSGLASGKEPTLVLITSSGRHTCLPLPFLTSDQLLMDNLYTVTDLEEPYLDRLLTMIMLSKGSTCTTGLWVGTQDLTS